MGTNIKFHTMKFILLSILFLGLMIKGILTDYPFPDSCSTLNCQEVTGCNRTGYIIGKCIPWRFIPSFPCLCDEDTLVFSTSVEEPVQDCWDNNKCILDKHCGRNGKCILYGFIGGLKKSGLCQCNVSVKKCMSEKDCRITERCYEGKCLSTED